MKNYKGYYVDRQKTINELKDLFPGVKEGKFEIIFEKMRDIFIRYEDLRKSKEN